MKMGEPGKSRQYDTEFKRNAVELYLSNNNSLKKINEDINLYEPTLNTWIKKCRTGENSSFGPKELTAHEQEMLTLKKQLADITMERDILKKPSPFPHAKNRLKRDLSVY